MTFHTLPATLHIYLERKSDKMSQLELAASIFCHNLLTFEECH